MSRQQLRRTRLLELEREQHLEDAEGLLMTEEQRQSLLDSFISVKLEFHDLDGLRWTQTALRRRQHTRQPTALLKESLDRPLALQLGPQVAAYDLDATIRGFKHNHNSCTISSPSFWSQDPEIDTLALGFPLPPSTIPSKHVQGTTFTFSSGLGLVSPVFRQSHSCTTPQLDTDFLYDTMTYAHLSPSHSPQWTSQVY